MAKQRMSTKKMLAIWIPVLAVIVAIMIAVTIVMNFFSSTLDWAFGRGARSEGDTAYAYYTNKYENENRQAANDAALAAALEVSRNIGNEGIVLLKNDVLSGKTEKVLPLERNSSEVTPFGYRYLYPAYSIFGSGSIVDGGVIENFGNYGPEGSTMSGKGVTRVEDALASAFTVNNETVSRLEAWKGDAKIGEAPGTTKSEEKAPGGCNGGHTYLYEYDAAVYEGAEASCEGTTGIVFLARDAGEGGDLKMDGYSDGTPHQLALSEREKDTIAFAKEHCTEGVIVVLNSGNIMQIPELVEGEYEVDAVLWMGFPGSVGFQSLVDIISGKVNPSGRTVDTWAADFTADPTYANIGRHVYSNAQYTKMSDNAKVDAPFVEYEEGVYVGYKYYETADVMDDSFVYEDEVLFPFGYGLSYTEFEQEIVGDPVVEDGEVSVTVRVTNTGEITGKEVVQLYYTPPYTDFDISNKIEKPVKSLVAFDKVEAEPGEENAVETTLTFALEDMASYCYTRSNPDGTKGAYVLENGDYTLTVGKNSHEAWATCSVNVPETVWYDSENPRQTEKDGQARLDDNGIPTNERAAGGEFVAASNRFDDLTEYMSSDKVTRLTRSNWTGSFPTAPTTETCTASEDVASGLERFDFHSFDPETDPDYGNVSTSKVYQATAPTSDADNGLTVSDMRGVDYYDEKWDLLLDQINYSATTQLEDLLFVGGYQINKLDSIGLFASGSNEGPSGFGIFTRQGWPSGATACGYCCGAVLASTWNVDLAYAMGEAVAYEAMNVHTDTGNWINGWTGPAMNLHRSPFGGRNGEYYSEDALLSGRIGCAEINGASDNGMYTIFKHFALNDLETDRWGICTWADEQTVRETYLKTFEIVFKESRRTVKYIDSESGEMKTKIMRGCTGVMTSMNRLGVIPVGGHYNLLTEVLRGEWGFEGFVQTDMPSQTNRDLMLRTGGDLQMTTMFEGSAEDMTSATAKHCIRRAVKNLAYAVVNSSAMQGIAPGGSASYGMSPWAVILLVANIVVYAIVIAIAVLLVLRVIDARKHPEKYKGSDDKTQSA